MQRCIFRAILPELKLFATTTLFPRGSKLYVTDHSSHVHIYIQFLYDFHINAMNGRLSEEVGEKIDIQLRAEEDVTSIALKRGVSISQVYRPRCNLTVFGNIEAP